MPGPRAHHGRRSAITCQQQALTREDTPQRPGMVSGMTDTTSSVVGSSGGVTVVDCQPACDDHLNSTRLGGSSLGSRGHHSCRRTSTITKGSASTMINKYPSEVGTVGRMRIPAHAQTPSKFACVWTNDNRSSRLRARSQAMEALLTGESKTHADEGGHVRGSVVRPTLPTRRTGYTQRPNTAGHARVVNVPAWTSSWLTDDELGFEHTWEWCAQDVLTMKWRLQAIFNRRQTPVQTRPCHRSGGG